MWMLRDGDQSASLHCGGGAAIVERSTTGIGTTCMYMTRLMRWLSQLAVLAQGKRHRVDTRRRTSVRELAFDARHDVQEIWTESALPDWRCAYAHLAGRPQFPARLHRHSPQLAAHQAE